MNTPHSFSSRIAERISRKLIRIYTMIYLLLLLFLLLILTPLLYHESVRKSTQLQSVLTADYELLQTQLAEGMNSFSGTFWELVSSYEKKKTDALHSRIVQELSSYAASHQNFAAIGLHLPDGEYISSIYYTNLPQQEILLDNMHYQNLLSSYSNSYYSPFYPDGLTTLRSEVYGTTQDDFLYFSKNYLNGTRSYTLTVFYTLSSTLKKNDALAASSFDSYYIIDKYRELIYATDDMLPDEVSRLMHKGTDPFTGTGGNFRLGGGRCFYLRIPSTGWTVVSYVSYFHMLDDLFLTLSIVTALYLLSPALYTLFLIPVVRRQLAPLKTLSDAMSSFQAGEDIRAEIHTQDEIEDLSSTFNRMVLAINRQVQDIQAKERENAVVSYKLLATQIDPHFIYNTMNIINIMAHQGKTDEIVEVNTALTRILRERLNSKLSILDTVRNEYETMLQFATIMDYRYGHQIWVHYDISESLMDHQIPKNLLQPLVENSFYHGFSHLESPLSGHIDIMIYPADDEIVIEVSDDGHGMSQKRIEDILNQSYEIYKDKKPHIGLHNIRQRLQYIYGEKGQMEIHSTEGIGTTVILTLPASQKPV